MGNTFMGKVPHCQAICQTYFRCNSFHLGSNYSQICCTAFGSLILGAGACLIHSATSRYQPALKILDQSFITATQNFHIFPWLSWDKVLNHYRFTSRRIFSEYPDRFIKGGVSYKFASLCDDMNIKIQNWHHISITCMLIFRTGHVHLIGQINKTGHLMKPCSEVVIYNIPERSLKCGENETCFRQSINIKRSFFQVS